MKPPGSYKIRYQRAARSSAPAFESDSADPIDALLAHIAGNERRTQRLVDSLREEILEEGSTLRIRQVFSTPREVYRIELHRPELGYQRITLLGREALETLLESDEVRHAVEEVAQSA